MKKIIMNYLLIVIVIGIFCGIMTKYLIEKIFAFFDLFDFGANKKDYKELAGGFTYTVEKEWEEKVVPIVNLIEELKKIQNEEIKEEIMNSLMYEENKKFMQEYLLEKEGETKKEKEKEKCLQQ